MTRGQRVPKLVLPWTGSLGYLPGGWAPVVLGQGQGAEVASCPTCPLPKEDKGEENWEIKGAEADRDGEERAAQMLITSARNLFLSLVCFSVKQDIPSQLHHKIVLLCGNNFHSRGTNLIV